MPPRQNSVLGLSLSQVVFLAVIIVLILVFVAALRGSKYGHVDYWKANYVETPDQVYARSSGVFDEAARLALERSEAPAAPSMADHHRAAQIIQYNVLAQADPGAGSGLPAASPAERREFQAAMRRRARNHAAAALAQITPADLAEEALAEGRPRANTPRPSAVIDTALALANRRWDPRHDEALAVFIQIEENEGQPLAEMALDRKNSSIQMRRLSAKEAGSGVKKNEASAYLEMSKQNTSDSQNSHDPGVNAAKKAIVARLRADQGSLMDNLPTLGDIKKSIQAASDDLSRDPRSGRPRPALTRNALEAVDRAARGDISMSAEASDEEVLRRVWARTLDPRNRDNAAALRQAVFDGLVDCWKRGIGGDHIVCVDGRVSRLVGALALLDHDQRNWDIQRLEHHKNAVFSRAAEVIHAAAEDAAASEDAGYRRVGLSYLAETPDELAGLGPVDGRSERKWVEDTRARIVAMIDGYVADLNSTSPGAIPQYVLDNLKVEACSALTA